MAERAQKLEVLVLNRVAQAGLQRFPAERYALVTESQAPDVVLLRSQNLHGAALGERLVAVGRAGAGTNNIPVAELSARGVPVFNTPGEAQVVQFTQLGAVLVHVLNPVHEFVGCVSKRVLESSKQPGRDGHDGGSNGGRPTSTYARRNVPSIHREKAPFHAATGRPLASPAGGAQMG
jgi:hypothetical protein